ncbi:MAG: hypothetical protein AAF627_13770 [Myxococcota bacterium]
MTGTLGLLLCAGTLIACDGPCRTLNERICGCETTTLERNACLDLLDLNARNRTVTVEEEEQCEALLETCTCAALDQNQPELCGISR